MFSQMEEVTIKMTFDYIVIFYLYVCGCLVAVGLSRYVTGRIDWCHALLLHRLQTELLFLFLALRPAVSG